ncbi:hypothetical protein RQP46_009397 [Phenoliferia psychrophenolica]
MMRKSPFFLPALVALLAFVLFLLFSAIRIASNTDTIAVPAYEKPTPNRPATPNPKAPATEDVKAGKPRLTPLEVKRAAEAALENSWDLGLGSDGPEPAGQVDTPVEKAPKVLGKTADELAAAKLRFAELQKEMADMDSDELTMMLNDAYRAANTRA